MRAKYKLLVGYGHVHPRENAKARAWGEIFFRARAIIVILLSFQWYLELHDKITNPTIFYANCAIWFYFIIETTRLLTVVDNKKRYLKENWPIPLIQLTGIQLLFWPDIVAEFFTDGARLILIIWLVVPWIEVCMDSMSDNKLISTILTALFIIILSGVMISAIDPAVEDPWDGIWWAWVTITTVGYGDVVPTSAVGRVFAFCLIMVGLLLFSAFTANFSAIFIKQRLKKNLSQLAKAEEEEIMRLTELMKVIDKKIEKLSKKIDSISED